MRNHLLRIATLTIITSLLLSGCMFCRGVDRKFLGWSATHPEYPNRTVTGIAIIPLAFALDVVTFPIQGLLIIMFGDNWPFDDTQASHFVALNSNPQFQQLSEERKALALAELKDLMRSGMIPAKAALVLDEDGHWTPVHLSAQARATLLARTHSAAPEMVAFGGTQRTMR